MRKSSVPAREEIGVEEVGERRWPEVVERRRRGVDGRRRRRRDECRDETEVLEGRGRV